MRSRGPVFAPSAVLLTLVVRTTSSFAIPAFPGPHGTSCTACDQQGESK